VTGLEPATSGVTGRRKRLINQRLIHSLRSRICGKKREIETCLSELLVVIRESLTSDPQLIDDASGGCTILLTTTGTARAYL
jgi:hypothetical protein